MAEVLAHQVPSRFQWQAMNLAFQDGLGSRARACKHQSLARRRRGGRTIVTDLVAREFVDREEEDSS